MTHELPGSANFIERRYCDPIDKTLQRYGFHCATDVIRSIEENRDSHNDAPGPYARRATGEPILARVARRGSRLDTVS